MNINNLKKWLFALLLSLPVFFLYASHFFNHDNGHKPTGMIQWEHALYMIAAKEYQTGNAALLYQYPLADDPQSPKVFFQPQVFVLGYVWKWTSADPGILLAVFGLIFTLLTMRVVIAIMDAVVTIDKYKKLLTILFAWGGGLLALCGCLLHFIYFKGNGNIADHLFFLDPGDGWWCLNFGRSLIYPFEACYHFLFVLAILLMLRKKWGSAALVCMLLTISHPYTSSELMAVVCTWALAEYFYVRSGAISKKGLVFIVAALVFHLLYYGVLLKLLPVYKTISRQAALDWGYKAWHFVPAYCIVWLLSFLAVKNVPLLKKQFSSPVNRLFFCWGTMAFLLSVHGFAIKPVQPLHFTRGYVYAGFFLFSIPALTNLIEWVQRKKKYALTVMAIAAGLLFLSDNILWFYCNSAKNNAGVYLGTSEQELVHFFKDKKEKGWVIGSEKEETLTTFIQLYSSYKGWMPHPFLTFDMDSKKEALQKLLFRETIDPRWKSMPAYFYINKKDTAFTMHPVHFPVKFENETFKVFQIN